MITCDVGDLSVTYHVVYSSIGPLQSRSVWLGATEDHAVTVEKPARIRDASQTALCKSARIRVSSTERVKQDLFLNQLWMPSRISPLKQSLLASNYNFLCQYCSSRNLFHAFHGSVFFCCLCIIVGKARTLRSNRLTTRNRRKRRTCRSRWSLQKMCGVGL